MFKFNRHISAVVSNAIQFILLLSLFMFTAPNKVFGQAVLNPNQIRGAVVFENASPVVRAPHEETNSYRYIWSTADSVGLERTLRHYVYSFYPAGASARYEMTVETSADGISYDVGSEAVFGKTSRFRYKFKSVRSPAIRPEPTPDTVVDLKECTSLARVNFVDTNGAPTTIDGGRIIAWEPVRTEWGYYLTWHSINYELGAQVSSDYIPVRGDGTTFQLQITYQRGTDPYSNRVSYSCAKIVTGKCDEPVDVTCVVPDPVELGSISGAGRIAGERTLLNL